MKAFIHSYVDFVIAFEKLLFNPLCYVFAGWVIEEFVEESVVENVEDSFLDVGFQGSEVFNHTVFFDLTIDFDNNAVGVTVEVSTFARIVGKIVSCVKMSLKSQNHLLSPRFEIREF